jgi:hypothetical protein
MPVEGKVVRDFIYVDIERLYSLYSQLFEGVADQIIQSYMDEATSKKSQKGSMLKGEDIENQLAEMSRRTENKFLHDHMYNLLEDELSRAIQEPSGVNKDNYRDVLKDAFIVKVNGTAKINDFGRASIFIEKINALAESFASLVIYSDEAVAARKTFDELVRSMPNSKEKEQAKKELSKFKDPKTYAKESGWSVDENLIKAMRQILDFGFPDAMQLVVTPLNGSENVDFTGVLDKRWLRIQPEFLRALYGGEIEWNWTMVGQLTFLPGAKPLTQEDVAKLSSPDISTDNIVSLKAPLQTVFERLRFFERVSLEGGKRIEVIVSPLAVYRETFIPLKPSSEAAKSVASSSHTTA